MPPNLQITHDNSSENMIKLPLYSEPWYKIDQVRNIVSLYQNVETVNPVLPGYIYHLFRTINMYNITIL